VRIENLIVELRRQLGDHQSTEKIDFEERKRRNVDKLQEIFSFYCRQHLGKKPTFDDMERETQMLNLGDFVKFGKDFEIALKPSVLYYLNVCRN